ncbi:MAG: extracellular solute-binding protein [Nitrospirae bacterium]|nr:extracellular solute-binding protein [Nitrospirota bacterium]
MRIFTVLFVFLLLLSPSLALSDEITLWLMAGECLPERAYSGEDLRDFAARYPNAGIDIGQDKERSMLVLMENRGILQSIEDFRRGFLREKGLDPGGGDLIIRVMFIGWHEDPIGRILDNAVNSGVDVVQIGSTWTAALVQRGVLEEISDVVKPVEGEYINSALQGCRILGESGYYAIPWVLDIRTWFYNRELFDEAGIKAESLKTLDDLERACEKFKANVKEKDIWFVGIPTSGDDYSTLHSAMTWIWGWGGNIVNGKGLPGIGGERAIEGMSRYVGLAVKGCAPMKGRDGKALRLVDIETDFLQGKYAMIFIGPWILDAVIGAERPDRFVNAGSMSGPAVSFGNIFTGGSQLALINSPRSLMEEEASKELLKFLSFRGNSGAGLSPRIVNFESLLKDPKLRTYPLTLIRQEFRTYPSIPEWGEVESIMVRHITNVFQRVGEGEDSRSTITGEFEVARQEITRSMGRARLPEWGVITVIMFVGGSFFFLGWLFLKRRSSRVEVVDAVRKFHRIKDVLHRAKVWKGCVKDDDEEVSRFRGLLSGHLETALEESRRLKTVRYGYGPPDEMTRILESVRAVITGYQERVGKEDLSREEYETVLIDYFENKIRPLIDEMSRVLKDKYYVDCERLEAIIRELRRSHDFEYDSPAGMKKSDTMVVSPEDLRSCLGNLLQNAQDVVRDIDNPQIRVSISVSEEFICISVKDNGRGFRLGYRGRGHGLNDVERSLGRWGGELGIAEGDDGKGTVMTLKIRKF